MVQGDFAPTARAKCWAAQALSATPTMVIHPKIRPGPRASRAFEMGIKR